MQQNKQEETKVICFGRKSSKCIQFALIYLYTFFNISVIAADIVDNPCLGDVGDNTCGRLYHWNNLEEVSIK